MPLDPPVTSATRPSKSGSAALMANPAVIVEELCDQRNNPRGGVRGRTADRGRRPHGSVAGDGPQVARFMEDRVDGLTDAPRPGAPRKITDEQVEVVVTRTLTEKGGGQDTHWSTRSMADETGLSQSSVSRIWRAFGLKPHLVETWKLSTDRRHRVHARARGSHAKPPQPSQADRQRNQPDPGQSRAADARLQRLLLGLGSPRPV